MNLRIRKCLSPLIIVVLHIITSLSNAQPTKVRGQVFDAVTGEMIPFVSVSFKNSTIGTITDFNGGFFIETRNPTDSLVITYMGYKPQKREVNHGSYQEFEINLEPDNIALEEVVVRPGENPAHRILRKIIDNKERHHPENLQSYQYEVYNKVEVDINNVDEQFQKRKIFNQFQFVFDHVDTSSLTGKPYLPILITESISDYYYQSIPEIEKEIIKASKISGFENESLSQFTGRMFQKTRIYNNFITMFEPGFVSPIADFGLLYYKYYLIDSSFIENKWCYKISYKPIRKHERTFSGYFIVHDTTFAIKEIQLRIAEDANINFINDLATKLIYEQVQDSIWFLTEESFIVDFNLDDRLTGFFGRKTTTYKDIRINEPIQEHVLQLKNDVVVQDNAMKHNTDFWEQKRHINLSEKEERIYSMVDSVKQVPIFKTTIDVINLLTNYYYPIGYFEYGPYYTTYSHNPVEGHRFRIGGRTSNKFSTRFMPYGHIAYGTKDETFKYGMGYLYMFSKNPRMATGTYYENDIQQLGQSDNAFQEDNIMRTLLERRPNDKLTMVREFRTFYEHEWFHGFSNKLTFSHKTIYPTPVIPFEMRVEQDMSVSLNRLVTSEITLQTHWARDEKFVMGEFERISLGTKRPVFDLYLTAGVNGIIGSDYHYYRATFTMKDKIETNPFGYFWYFLEGGKIFGTLPYPLLELHKGNETYAYDQYAFNMMNYYEFISDQYISFNAEHHFQGFFLGHIPLLRKLEWREVISAKGVMGTLSDKNRNEMMFPGGLTSLKKPYLEVGAGIENIFKFFRIDAMWRITHTDHENIQLFGIRAKIQVIL
ncbi:MAG: carboxypeptidase-like regulatory domain-containing protein [Bacteroidetes bacterium]|jgi:hypothetical protein|nr:carboxypeptidase-like regulatory domain-containing protein [Bacteroidota bacterium]